ncbi:MAG: cytochrome c3 family protein [Acidobacteria bacterium]|nr:cytochrome c3 family protein [Acidobacteriota bacterium]
MKKLLVICIGLVMAGAVMAQGIAGSAHDFSGDTWNSTGQICITCHTPHNADTTVSGAPLWNHQVTTATFTLYSSTTLDANDLGQPDGVSKLCLSCHDGTVGLEAFGGVNTVTDPITGTALLGTDLANDHPVSFTYNTSLATTDGELYDPSTVNSGLGSTIDADMLYSGKMECSSCHDVHNTPGIAKLLVKSNAASALCLTCHNK